ncbi:AAA family ATPase [Kitasatospora sp. NPDC088391]|uniref:AAA family ATPase n=1 Tax=Kitasatospora sp. NPDC088391 TaxID=3364074 RepID=UPI00380D7D35
MSGTTGEGAVAEPGGGGAGRVVVLVNGMPAAGKTTLARALGRRLGLPLFSKDAIKEAHAGVLGAQPPDGRPQREWNRQLGAAASAAMWALLADAPGGAVLDSTWPAAETWEYVRGGLLEAGVDRPLQIWCEVPVEVARRRHELRHPTRHPLHGASPDVEEWYGRWARATPLPLARTRRVDTARPVDLDALAEWCRRTAALPSDPAGSGFGR